MQPAAEPTQPAARIRSLALATAAVGTYHWKPIAPGSTCRLTPDTDPCAQAAVSWRNGDYTVLWIAFQLWMIDVLGLQSGCSAVGLVQHLAVTIVI